MWFNSNTPDTRRHSGPADRMPCRVARRASSPALLGVFAVSAYLVIPGAVPSASAQEVLPLVTEAQYARWLVDLSNWGRWGPDDELGALNLITPAKRRAAAALVREGITVSLARTAATEEGVDNPCPVEWEMVTASLRGASDRVAYRCIHGLGSTHIDGFAHRFFDGKMWNGYPVSDLVTMEHGAQKNADLTMKDLLDPLNRPLTLEQLLKIEGMAA